jgi:hypothetical protein
MNTKREPETASSKEELNQERGEPGGGKGRIDVVGETGVYPGSGPYPPGEAEIRTPGSWVHGQVDAEGREVEGGSGLTYLGGDMLLGGATPPPSGPRVTPQPPADRAKSRKRGK